MMLKSYLLRKASIGNWLFWLMALCILLQFVFLRLEVRSFNNVERIAEDQQAIIDLQQDIIQSAGIPNAESIHFDSLIH
jgi:hypothetical protein